MPHPTPPRPRRTGQLTPPTHRAPEPHRVLSVLRPSAFRLFGHTLDQRAQRPRVLRLPLAPLRIGMQADAAEQVDAAIRRAVKPKPGKRVAAGWRQTARRHFSEVPK